LEDEKGKRQKKEMGWNRNRRIRSRMKGDRPFFKENGQSMTFWKMSVAVQLGG
jgi:hypothetical protein